MTILQAVRIAQNKTRAEMAQLLGLNYYTYRSYEQGVREMPPRVLRDVLILRGGDEDIKLADILTEVYSL